MLTHANLAWKNFADVTEFGFTADDVGLACGPLYHVGALDLVTTTMIAVGATTIVHTTFDAEQVVDEIERSRVTTIWAAPAMVRAVLDVPGIESRDLSSVRVHHRGRREDADPHHRTHPQHVPVGVVRRRVRAHGDRLRRHLPRPRPHRQQAGQRRPSVPVPRARHLGRSTARRSRRAQRGEVVLRGPKVFAGYWRDPDATAAAFRGGWFHTGDIGVLDDDGFLSIVDRLKDMIVSGGENIASSEVERVLYEHDAVVEAAVVGRPDDRWGEVPVAFVVVGEDRPSHPTSCSSTAAAARQVQDPQGRRLHRRPPPQPLRQGPQARPPRPALLTRHPHSGRGVRRGGP